MLLLWAMALSIWELHNEPEEKHIVHGPTYHSPRDTSHILLTTLIPPTYHTSPSPLLHPLIFASYTVVRFLILLGCSNYMQSSTGDQEWKEARDRAERPTLEANSLAPDSTDVV